jgi:hypothetical protein
MPARPEIAGRTDQAGTAGRPVDPVDVTEDSADRAVPDARKHHPVDPVVAAATVGCTVPGAIARTAPRRVKAKAKNAPERRPIRLSVNQAKRLMSFVSTRR